MDIKGRTVVHLAQYAAPYLGNFVKSLMHLEERLKKDGGNMVYVFPPQAGDCAWFEDFASKHEVGLILPGAAGVAAIEAIIKKYNGKVLMHTHFEGYDEAVCKAVRHRGYDIPVVWHLHDHLSYQPNILKAMYQRWCFFRHYCLPTLRSRVYTIAVSQEVDAFVRRFGGRFKGSIVLPNGIDISRIYKTKDWTFEDDGIRRFVCFGGRNIQKRMDIALEAFKMLYDSGRLKPGEAMLRVVIGTDSRDVFSRVFGSDAALPQWLEPIEQDEDIVRVFDGTDCFISAAQHETFSYAVCEATLYGLAVIQSDIPGTMWNAGNPSVKLFKSLDVSDLADKIEDFISIDRHKLAEDTAITAARNRTKYTLDAWCDSVLKMYEKIVKC